MKKLLKKETTRSYLMGIATVLGVYGLIKIGCGVLILNIILAIATIALANSMKVRKNFSRKFRVIVGGAIISLLLGIGLYHATNCHKVVLTEKNDSAVVDTTKDEIPAQEEQKVEEKKETPVVSKGTDRSNTVEYDKDGYAKQDLKDITTHKSYETEDGSKGITSVEGEREFDNNTKKESDKDVVFSQPDDKPSEEKAATNNDKTEEAPKSNGNVVTDSKKQDELLKQAFENNSKSNETVKSETTVKDSTKKAETKSSATTKETTKPEVETKSSTTTKEAPKSESKNVPETSTNKAEEKKEDTKKSIRIEALDSYSAYVGESIQFKIEGENVQFEGLEGMEYSFSKGILTIECGEYATVLTVRVFNDSNSANFNVYINGLR